MICLHSVSVKEIKSDQGREREGRTRHANPESECGGWDIKKEEAEPG